jgi:hypothetical protein
MWAYMSKGGGEGGEGWTGVSRTGNEMVRRHGTQDIEKPRTFLCGCSTVYRSRVKKPFTPSLKAAQVPNSAWTVRS